VKGHQKSKGATEAGRKRISILMKLQNPMKDPAVAQRVSKKTRGRPMKHTTQGKANIAKAARKRMLSDKNPMKNPSVHREAMKKILARDISKNEQQFLDWILANNLPIIRTGDGTLWIGRRNPDFRVVGQKKVIEVTQKECFIGQRKSRNSIGYGQSTIRHYLSKGWQCLVVFKKDHRSVIPDSLLQIISDFISKDSRCSGVWNYDRLIPYEELRDVPLFTTSPVILTSPTSPTA